MSVNIEQGYIIYLESEENLYHQERYGNLVAALVITSKQYEEEDVESYMKMLTLGYILVVESDVRGVDPAETFLKVFRQENLEDGDTHMIEFSMSTWRRLMKNARGISSYPG